MHEVWEISFTYGCENGEEMFRFESIRICEHGITRSRNRNRYQAGYCTVYATFSLQPSGCVRNVPEDHVRPASELLPLSMISPLQPRILSGLVHRFGRVRQCDQLTYEEREKKKHQQTSIAFAHVSHGHVMYLTCLLSWPLLSHVRICV